MALIITTFVVVLCVVPAMVIAIPSLTINPFIVKGRVYCDPCRLGFETPITTYIPSKF
ncbi:putative pollen allergen Ole e 1 family [Lupinus albus]|uniref:Putative pollen allergen Ole e 1 family n=1 Tax=Lupinus albus TaxID=3870 RepID=A0A6A4PUT7_LUPAL|nr:putative pollen allergen Ole e 1 family [Lupinus albus]